MDLSASECSFIVWQGILGVASPAALPLGHGDLRRTIMLYTGLVLVMPSSTLTSEAGSRDFFRFKRPIQEKNHMELAYNK